MSLLMKDTSMKPNLGKRLLLLLLFFTAFLQAQSNPYCTYTIKSSKSSDILINEPISIVFNTRQKLHNEVMFFDLKAQESDDYEIISIKEDRHEFNYHDAKKEFEFLLIPKKEGTLKVNFSFDIRRASDDAVSQAYVGSRDNVKSIPTIKVHIAKPSVQLQVKRPTQETDAVGHFSLKVNLDKQHSNAYDAINLVYTLDGKGYLNEAYAPIKEIKGVSIFKGIKEVPKKATSQGYIYHKEWSYALVSDKDYTIPSVSLNVYHPKLKKYIQQTTASYAISITPLNVENILDDKEAPENPYQLKNFIQYIYYLLIFIAGFLTAYLWQNLPKKLSKKEVCCQLVMESKTPKEALMASLKFNNKGLLQEEINQLEQMVYNSASRSNFKQVKAEIITKIKRGS